MANTTKYPDDIDLLNFEKGNRLLIPKDLKEYFLGRNNVKQSDNADMYNFYSFFDFKSVENELKDWKGIPDYSNLVNTLNNHENCYVFADYMFHMFTYAIRLYNEPTAFNEIYILTGEKYLVIAKSFSEFVNLYKQQSTKLQFES